MSTYLSYLNKLIDQYNNTYHHSTAKKPIDADCSDLNQVESSYKAVKFKVSDRVRITKYRNIFRKVYIENCSKEMFIIGAASKNNP